jgi:hypothetical protein
MLSCASRTLNAYTNVSTHTVIREELVANSTALDKCLPSLHSGLLLALALYACISSSNDSTRGYQHHGTVASYSDAFQMRMPRKLFQKLKLIT